MANKRVGTLEMRLRLETREVEPIHLGVTLPDVTEWALRCILIKDDDTNWAAWHEIDGLERVCHTDDLPDSTKRLVQFVITKPLQKAQTYPSVPQVAAYRTVSLPVWQHAYNLLDTVGFPEDDFCTPLGVYVASMVHGVRECGGGDDVYAPHAVHHGHTLCCGWKPLPDRVNRYVLGMVAAKEKCASTAVEFAGRDMTLVVTGSKEHWTASMDYLGALRNIWVCVWNIGGSVWMVLCLHGTSWAAGRHLRVSMGWLRFLCNV